MGVLDPARLWPPGALRRERLDSGLELLLLEEPQAAVCTVSLTYRVGARDDPTGGRGLAHFLEHMMFKGSPRYAAGDVDRVTLALGGENNAFTSHDASTYYFSFGGAHWEEAIRIEADRMRSLTLERSAVESERAVILEEIAMYEAEPWERLDRAVRAALYREHPYGQPVLGTSDDVSAIDAGTLGELHRSRYRPDAAVLTIAGPVDLPTARRACERFEAAGEPSQPRARLHPPTPLRGGGRIELGCGEVPRTIRAFLGCPGDDADFAALRLVAALLGTGRASRLHRRLVEQEHCCAWVSIGLEESESNGVFSVAAELVPGADPDLVESLLDEELRRLRSRLADDPEIERARRVVLADWVFEHERTQARSLTLAQAAVLFDAEAPRRQLEAVVAADARRLRDVAVRYLDPGAGCVVGWARPAQ